MELEFLISLVLLNELLVTPLQPLEGEKGLWCWQEEALTGTKPVPAPPQGSGTPGQAFALFSTQWISAVSARFGVFLSCEMECSGRFKKLL